jgi:hypothetical protein
MYKGIKMRTFEMVLLYMFPTITFFIVSCEIASDAPEGKDKACDTITNMEHLPEDEGDFRKTRWGMSEAEVLALEKGKEPVSRSDKQIVYEIYEAGYETSLFYFFDNDNLWGGLYVFKVQHTDANDYFPEFDNIRKFIVERYGNPDIVADFWINEEALSRYPMMTDAIVIGQAIRVGKWIGEDSLIVLLLGKDKEIIRLCLGYSSYEYGAFKEMSKIIKYSKDF